MQAKSNQVIMSFSYNQEDNDYERENGQPSDRNSRGRRRSFSVFSIILLILAIILMIVFVSVQRSNSTLKYGDNSLIFNVDADYDDQPDLTEDGYPDLSRYYSDAFSEEQKVKAFSIRGEDNPEGIILPNKDGYENRIGELAYYLLNSKEYSVTVSIEYSNINGNIMYLKGRITLLGTRRVAQYSASISKTVYEKYADVIFKNYCNEGKLVYANVVPTVQSSNVFLSVFLPILVQLLVYGIIGYMMFRIIRSVASQNGPNAMSGFVNNLSRKQRSSKVRFADVAGCDEAKVELIEMVDYFRATDRYTRLGAKLPHGVLLQGPPGTGKTLLAKAVAGEANVPFYSISGSDFVEMYVGVGASRVRSLFKSAKQNAPCLIFIDEIDAVGRQRGAGLGGGNDEREQTLNELLVEMDGFEDNSGIIVMAATNRSDVLDPALTRPGRFDRTITVDLPNKAGRRDILKVHSRNKTVASEVSFDSIASRTVGFSGADLANIMNDAAILAVRANRDAITMADIDEAIDRAVAGPAKNSHLEEKEKKQVAYHESGHAVIGLFLPDSDVVQKITIVPRGRTGGHVLMTPEKDRFLMTKKQLLARITGYLGGRTSEEIFFGDVSTGASNDIEVATQIARSMVTQYGMSGLGPIQYERPDGSVFLGRDYNSTQANYSTEIAFEIDKEVRSIIDKCHLDAKKILTEHKKDVELIAQTLIERETITSDEISYLLKHRKMPDIKKHIKKEVSVNNPNSITLYPGYEILYSKVDDILKEKPSNIIVVFGTQNGVKLSKEEFKNSCVSRLKDPSKVGVLFIDQKLSSLVSISPESFGYHIEAYAGIEVLLVKCDYESVNLLSSK